MLKPYVMDLSYHRWLDRGAMLLIPCDVAANLLPTSVLNAAMETKDAYVVHARVITHVVKRCGCHWSTRREPMYAAIPAGILLLSGSQPT